MLATTTETQLGELIAKAWSEPGFAKRLKIDPGGVLAEIGIEIPEGHSVEVVENTASKTYLTIPAPPERQLLTDSDVLNTLSGQGAKGSPSWTSVFCCQNTKKTSNYCCTK